MDIACSTLCFTREPLTRALRHIAELEFSKIDLGIYPNSPHITPEEVQADPASVARRLRQGPTIGFAALTLKMNHDDPQLVATVESLALLAKLLPAPYIVLHAAPKDTPIELEIQRLQPLMLLAMNQGATISLMTERGTLTEECETADQLCQAIPGLSLTFDPSHFLVPPDVSPKAYDSILPMVRHVHLRDSGLHPDEMQVKVGRGLIEYGHLIAKLRQLRYNGVLTVDIEDISPSPLNIELEVRKLSLLLESLT